MTRIDARRKEEEEEEEEEEKLIRYKPLRVISKHTCHNISVRNFKQ